VANCDVGLIADGARVREVAVDRSSVAFRLAHMPLLSFPTADILLVLPALTIWSTVNT
jgi:hypothetical protein